MTISCLVSVPLCCLCGTELVAGATGGGVEPWFTATLVVLTSSLLIFAAVVFIVCFCRRRRLHATYRSTGAPPSTDLLTYIRYDTIEECNVDSKAEYLA